MQLPSPCWSVLPALVDAARKKGISIDSRLTSGVVSKAFSNLFTKLGFREESNFEGLFGDIGTRAFPRINGLFVCPILYRIAINTV